jgi:hypothetical protein
LRVKRKEKKRRRKRIQITCPFFPAYGKHATKTRKDKRWHFLLPSMVNGLGTAQYRERDRYMRMRQRNQSGILFNYESWHQFGAVKLSTTAACSKPRFDPPKRLSTYYLKIIYICRVIYQSLSLVEMVYDFENIPSYICLGINSVFIKLSSAVFEKYQMLLVTCFIFK